MSMQPDQRKELPGTYFVQDRANIDERERVRLQDMMITKAMGGVLPEQADPASLHRVIDIGCGTGNWLIEVAKAYPEIKLLIGIDISQRMVEYAREQAQAEHVNERVEFHIMDALQYIAFPRHYFDLLNQRLGLSYLRTWDWPNILTKYQYVTRPGGVIRITEGDLGSSNSPAFNQLNELTLDAFCRAGHFFTPTLDGVTSKLPELFRNHGIKNVQTRTTQQKYYAGADMMDHFVEDTRLFFRTTLPFLRKWGHLPDNYDELCQQALAEIQQPGCITNWQMVTIWGYNN